MHYIRTSLPVFVRETVPPGFWWQACVCVSVCVCAGSHAWIRSTVETSLSCKSWGKRSEHVALHNKGIALQTTRMIGTRHLKQKILSVCLCVWRMRGHGEERSGLEPQYSCPDRGWGPRHSALIQSTSHTLHTWTPTNTAARMQRVLEKNKQNMALNNPT